MAKPRDREKKKKIAKERVEILFEQAQHTFSKNPKRANRYVELARKIAMKVNLRMPRIFKRKYCSHCYTYLQTGENARIRTREQKLIIYCKTCKKYTRIPLTKKPAKK
jgi:ribonuclease P protein subunit RPR2